MLCHKALYSIVYMIFCILMTWQHFEVPVATTGLHIWQKVLLASNEDRLMCGSQSWAKNCRAVANFVSLRYEAEKRIVDEPWRRTLQPKNGACWIRESVGDMSAIMTWKNSVQLNEVWLRSSTRIGRNFVMWHVVILVLNFQRLDNTRDVLTLRCPSTFPRFTANVSFRSLLNLC